MVAYKSLALFGLVLGVEAKPCKPVFSSSGSILGHCASALGSSSVDNIPTLTSVTTHIITTTSIVFASDVIVTVTPSPVDCTVTSTDSVTSTITAQEVVNTATTTFTNTNTITSSTTIIETETDTATVVTTSTSTSTVPIPAAVTPISEESEYVARRVRDISPNASICKAGPDGPLFSPTAYIQSVDCIQTVYSTSTVTVSITGTQTTTLATATSTSTAIITATVTTLSYPPDVTDTATVTTLVDFTTVLDVTTTTTLTSTMTISTVVEAATPYYAACGSINLLNTANGGDYIDSLAASGTTTKELSSIPSAYDCCVACQTDYSTTCIGTFYFETGQCYLYTTTSCTPGEYSNAEFWTTSATSSVDYVYVSNGPCGAIANGGSG
ncbi:hypothetical protein BX600DRAFT_519119 [Xylariales sp. PMI_506]|nr:hypothetical protein BX600DRAFT_519119 [Xylariales sp. PMI_506]